MKNCEWRPFSCLLFRSNRARLRLSSPLCLGGTSLKSNFYCQKLLITLYRFGVYFSNPYIFTFQRYSWISRRHPWGRNRLPTADQYHVLPDLTIITHGPHSSLSLQKMIADAKDQDRAFCTTYQQWFAPVLSFLSLVAGISPHTGKIVLQAGYLDLLLLTQKGNVTIKGLPEISSVFLGSVQIGHP